MYTALLCRLVFVCVVAELLTPRPSVSMRNPVSRFLLVQEGPSSLDLTQPYLSPLALTTDISSSKASASGKRIKTVLTDRNCLKTFLMEKKIVLIGKHRVGQFRCCVMAHCVLICRFLALPLIIFTSTSYEVPPKFNIIEL